MKREETAGQEQASQTELEVALLVEDARWIVRIQGQDMGPFSEREVVARLRIGEVAPETLILDLHTIRRCRLQEQQQLGSHVDQFNAENSVLLREERLRSWESFWQARGRRLVGLVGLCGCLLLAAGLGSWYLLWRGKGDVYLAPAQVTVAQARFAGVRFKKERPRRWDLPGTYRRKRRPSRENRVVAQRTVHNITFGTGAKAAQVPRQRLTRRLRRHSRTIQGCFLQAHRKLPRLTSVTLRFMVRGDIGRIGRIDREDAAIQAPLLLQCLRRNAQQWQFPRFQGHAFILLPLSVKSRHSSF